MRDKKSRYKIRYFFKIKGSHAENFSQIGAIRRSALKGYYGFPAF
jgi:hypothetical protein